MGKWTSCYRYHFLLQILIILLCSEVHQWPQQKSLTGVVTRGQVFLGLVTTHLIYSMVPLRRLYNADFTFYYSDVGWQ